MNPLESTNMQLYSVGPKSSQNANLAHSSHTVTDTVKGLQHISSLAFTFPIYTFVDCNSKSTVYMDTK